VITWVHSRLMSWSESKHRVEAGDPLFYAHKTVEARLCAGEIGSGQPCGPVVPVRELNHWDKAVDSAVRAMPRLQRSAIECRYCGPKDEPEQVRSFQALERKGKTTYYSAIDSAHWFIAGRLT